jgi:hypothetical protein
MKTKPKFFYAYDKRIDKVCPHVLKEKWLISLVTGEAQEYKEID